MNKRHLKAIYFRDDEAYREVIQGLKGMAFNIDLAFDNGLDDCITSQESRLLNNTYTRLRKFYDFADEVEEELQEEGWDTRYSAQAQGWVTKGKSQ